MSVSTEYDYARDSAEIYRRSFAIIRSEANLARFTPDEASVAVRVIHACGMVEIAHDLVFAPRLVEAARGALLAGAPIFCDSKMVANGITRPRLPAANDIVCTLDSPGIADRATRLDTTRSAAAIDLWLDRLGGSLVAIGNAPTALFRLLELVDQGAPKPAAIIGVPVGFIGATESKDALTRQDKIPFLVVRGRKGGSAMAVAAVNALSGEAE
jgi:precorrin-8X/cobalt-precorrin-8 methylmutase